MSSPALCTHTGGTKITLNSSPTTAPIRVSATRSQAVSATWATPSTSMALMATSGTNSLTRTRWPTVSAQRMSRPRLHQLSPTMALKPAATTTPTTTEVTRRMPLVMVAKRVTWTTSRAVSGASSGALTLVSQSAAM